MSERFHKHKIENLISIPKIVTIHYLEADKDFVFHGESHDFWEMVYADKNEVICTALNQESTVKAGMAIFHKPCEFHAIRANKSNAPNFFVITFECKSEAMRYFENKTLNIPPHLQEYIKSLIKEAKLTFKMEKQNPYLKKLELKNNPSLGGQQLIRLYLETFLILLLKEENRIRKEAIFIPTQDFGHALVNKIIALLKTDTSVSLSLDVLSKQLNYSKPFLCKTFLAQTGQSIMNYYHNLKIDLAKLMLREKNKSLTDIADALGFSTLSYFCKVFKKYTSMTPTQYISSVAI